MNKINYGNTCVYVSVNPYKPCMNKGNKNMSGRNLRWDIEKEREEDGEGNTDNIVTTGSLAKVRRAVRKNI